MPTPDIVCYLALKYSVDSPCLDHSQIHGSLSPCSGISTGYLPEFGCSFPRIHSGEAACLDLSNRVGSCSSSSGISPGYLPEFGCSFPRTHLGEGPCLEVCNRVGSCQFKFQNINWLLTRIWVLISQHTFGRGSLPGGLSNRVGS